MKIIDIKLDLRKKKQFCIVSLFQVLKVNKEIIYINYVHKS